VQIAALLALGDTHGRVHSGCVLLARAGAAKTEAPVASPNVGPGGVAIRALSGNDETTVVQTGRSESGVVHDRRLSLRPFFCHHDALQ
jgi:hypothetical protein